MSVSPLLFLHGITVTFGGLTIIENLDIKVARGSRTAIIGPNGAGKTTLFNLISGVYRSSAGQILFDNEPIEDMPLDRRVRLGIGRTFQNIRLMKHLTVLENVMLGQHCHVSAPARYLLPLKSRWNKDLIDEAMQALTLAGIRDDAERLAEGLPYGVQKRIEIARALVTRPRLLMLDEPAAGLNSSERFDLLTMLRSAITSETTMLIVEHDIGFVRSLCGHVVALNFGSKIAEGDADSVCKHPAVVEAYLGKSDQDAKSAGRPRRAFAQQRGGHAA